MSDESTSGNDPSAEKSPTTNKGSRGPYAMPGKHKVMPQYPGVRFTKFQQRMVDLFADGKPHTRQELWKCLGDDLAPLDNIKMHIWSIRNLIRPFNEDIICELVSGRIICYRHVKLLPRAGEQS